MATMTDLLAAAGVAAAVTLLIEYSAKPRLEARKDRILERARAKRKAAQLLMEVGQIAGHLGGLADIAANAEITGRSDIQLAAAEDSVDQRKRLIEISNELTTVTPIFAGYMSKTVRNHLGGAVGSVKGLAQSSRSDFEIAPLLHERTFAIGNYLAVHQTIPKVFWLRRIWKTAGTPKRRTTPNP